MFVPLSRQFRHLGDQLAEVIRDPKHVLPIDAEKTHADVVRRAHLVVYGGEHPGSRSPALSIAHTTPQYEQFEPLNGRVIHHSVQSLVMLSPVVFRNINIRIRKLEKHAEQRASADVIGHHQRRAVSSRATI